MTTPEKRDALALEAQKSTQLLALWKGFEIQDQASAQFLGEELVKVKTQAKELEAEKDKVTKPLWKAYKDVGGWFAPALQALAGIEACMKGKLGAWDRAQRAEQAKALEVASQLFQQGQHEKGLAVMQAVPETVTQVKGTSVRAVWKWEYVDKTKVTREYCEPSDPLVNRAVAAGVRDIPGVRIFEDSTVTVRT